MSQVQLKYRKGDEIKYISHRDLMRVMQRAIRRAEIPMAYSQGFNPHMKISWGQALKLGKTSESELVTLQLAAPMPPQDVMARLNSELPQGLEILEAFLV